MTPKTKRRACQELHKRLEQHRIRLACRQLEMLVRLVLLEHYEDMRQRFGGDFSRQERHYYQRMMQRFDELV